MSIQRCMQKDLHPQQETLLSLLKAQKYSEAFLYVKDLEDQAQDNPFILNWLGTFYLIAGDFVSAKEYLKSPCRPIPMMFRSTSSLL